MSGGAILSAGRVYCDLVFTGVPELPTVGQEVFANGLSLCAGGGAFITAATFDALGCKSALLATLPAAPFDEIIRRDLNANGIDAGLCVPAAAGDAPQITVAAAIADDRAFLSHKSGYAIPETEFATGSWQHLHIGELRTLTEHPDLVDRARTAGMSVSLDCGWDAELLGQGAALIPLIASVDVFLPNETEFEHLCQSGLPPNAAPITVVKRGAAGARVMTGGETISQSGEQVIVKDATGAGDAFNGGFIAEWLAGNQVEQCLAAGNACGAAAVREIGGTAGLRHIRKMTETGLSIGSAT